jgi:hypothetical protein
MQTELVVGAVWVFVLHEMYCKEKLHRQWAI